MNISNIIVNIALLLASSINFILAALVFYRKQKHHSAPPFAWFCLSVGLWALGIAFFRITPNLRTALFWNREFILSAGMIPILFIHFAYTFINKPLSLSKKLILYAPAIFILIGVLIPNALIKDIVVADWGKESILGYGYPLYGIYFTIYMTYGFAMLFQEYRKTEALNKLRLKYILLAILPASLIGAYFNLYLILMGDYRYIWVGPQATFAFVIITAFAIYKYHLMDIKLAITRAGIFIFVYILVLGIPFGVGFKYLGTGLWLVPVGLMTIFATVGPFLYFYLQRQAENTLLQSQIAYQGTLKQAAYGIGRIKNLDTLVKLIDRILIRSAGIEQCAIYLIDKQEENPVFNLTNNTDSLPPRITITPEVLTTLKCFSEPFIIEELVYQNPDNTDVKQMVEFLRPFQAEIVVPIVQSDKLLSLILLGRKKDRSLYTNDDLTVFTILASQAGLAMENCLFIEAEKERLEREGTSARRESLDMLVSTMAHEIDNPIQGAIGQSEMLKMCLEFFRDHLPKETMQEVNQYCDKIESNCMRVSKIVKAVEDYSKRETGEFKEVYINAVIIPYHSLVPMIQKQHKLVKYTEDIKEDLPPMWGEDIMIEEILMNLVENAYHAVIHNEGEMNVHLNISQKDDDTIRIEVKDNGYGIASKIKNQLFQVPTTTKGSSEGTGIGLYRIRQICELLKAKYGAESQGRGHGAVFYVEIPIYKGKS